MGEEMGIITVFVLCGFAVGFAQGEVTFEVDMPFWNVPVSGDADLECCYKTNMKPVKPSWVRSSRVANNTFMDPVNQSDHAIVGFESKTGRQCGTLTLKSVHLNDSGLYQCKLNISTDGFLSPGTYLQVYKPLKKTINLSESTKNKILTAEGILLLLCMLLPSLKLLFKSKRLHELEKKKMKREEENIYQGLNLDDCCAAYDQIERTKAQDPYQDVCNIMEEDEATEFEKP